MLTEQQKKLREFKLTASMLPMIMTGKEDVINRLWEELIGEREPPDFSNDWPVQLGSFIEGFGLDWHERRTGQPLVERGRVVFHPTLPDICATLDAYRVIDSCVLDHKVCHGWQKLDHIIDYYTPQIICQMRCRQSQRGSLLIVHGGSEPTEYDIDPDPAYERVMWDYALEFQRCVQTFTRPFPKPAVVPPDRWRTVRLVDEQSSWPNWGAPIADALKVWDENKDSAERYDQAAAEIKLLLPGDVRRVVHQGYEIKRNKRGAVTITRGNAE